MPQQIEIPEMGLVEFPDGMSDEDIAKAIQSNIAPKKEATQSQKAMVSDGMRFARGVSDPINGLAQILHNSVPGSVKNAMNNIDNWLYDKSSGLFGTNTTFDEALKAEEAKYQAARKVTGQTGIDGARMAGNIASSLPLAAAPLPPTLKGRVIAGGVMGSGLSAANPVYGGDYWDEKKDQALLGAATGAVSVPIGEGIARVIKPVGNKAAEMLRREGINFTPGQALGGFWKAAEEKATSLPIFGHFVRQSAKQGLDDFNRAAYNRALNPIGKSADKLPIGREGIDEVYNSLNSAYDDLLPKLSFKQDRQFIDEFSNLKSMLPVELGETELKKFNNVISRVANKMTPQGNMNGESLKAAQSIIKKEARGYSKNLDYDNQKLGDAINELDRILRTAVERQNPVHGAQLQNINKGYANYNILRKAGSMQGAESGFTPAQLSSASKAADSSVQKGATARGKALMQDLSDAGRDVLMNKYPDSGTAGRVMDAGLIAATIADPMIPLGLYGASTLYSKPAQKIIDAAIASRPAYAGPLAEAVRGASPVVGVGLLGSQ